MSFINKVVIITGAGSGIGEATAKCFAKLSARLALLDINAGAIHKVKHFCEKISNNKVLEIVADVSKTEDINRAVDEINKEFDRIDILVNCAGVMSFAGILDTHLLDEYDRVMNINLRSVIAMTHRVAPMLVDSKGCIINISSVYSKQVTMSTIPYSISKAGISHFTKCIALELASKGVRANCVVPGPTNTDIGINMGLSQAMVDMLNEKTVNSVPLKMILNPEEVAEMIIFLASEKCKGVTGAEFVIDSGMLLTSVDVTRDVK